ncbi:P-loop containing nucleoside triphosphate hydrolase protein [Panus rudis PR-1116 ss-1]|nr:P-loop containing nucleoside triphosphate hydrolase protein [Panus rudis PR-1116 ss-1]
MPAICPLLKTQGICQRGEGCQFRHDVLICSPCGAICMTNLNYQAHLRGKRHRKNTTGGGRVFQCTVCTLNVTEGQWEEHVGGEKHAGQAFLRGLDPDVEPAPAALHRDEKLCTICDRIIQLGNWGSHIQGRSHMKMKRLVAFRSAFEEAEQNKHGVVVSHEEGGVDFGIVELDNAKSGVTSDLTIQNTTPLAKISLVELRFGTKFKGAQESFTATRLGASNDVIYSRASKICVSFSQQQLGRYEDRIELVFEDVKLKTRFVIVRAVYATVGSQADHELFKPRAIYKPRKRTARAPERHITPGPPPASATAVKWLTRLPPAEIPRQLYETLVAGNDTKEVIATLNSTIIPLHFQCQTYGRRFQTLLWVEEFRMQRDLEAYDLPNAQLTRQGAYYRLEVPGLAENRPSVVVGDCIYVQRHGSDKGHWFEGHVHFVRLLEVGLRFHESFTGHVPTSRYNIRFKLNRLPLRRQHEVLMNAFNAKRLLFPMERNILLHQPPSEAQIASFQRFIYNPLIAGNDRQMLAVVSITSLPPGSPPFVVFGPPGTGKTVTIVEAILQLIRIKPNARIVACAPSNSAADLVALRLRSLGSDSLFRLYAPSRNKSQVPAELMPFTYMTPAPPGHSQRVEGTGDLESFSVPPMAVLRRFKVVVVTCVSAAVLHGVGIPAGHFTHVFIDEAGQATEPESMVSVKALCDNQTNVVLSGDPMQLGPIIRSPVARGLQLEVSYLERLMNMNTPYSEAAWRGITVVKLLKNFRSHPAILQFPNAQFYQGELQSCGDPSVIQSYIGWPRLSKREFPIIFHAVSGKDEREASSPSFFNITEVTQVKKYVEYLREDRRFRITNEEIGIIAPYQAQCGRLRRALSGYEGIKIGSVEEFQGQERRVIIISTVRSSREYISYDVKHSLGFVASPRRLNVAITRAKALVIIVGDPEVISLDPLWRMYLNEIFNKGGWKGHVPTWDTNAPVQLRKKYDKEVVDAEMDNMNLFTRRIASMTLGDVIDTEDDDDIDANQDRPWQEHDV